MTDPVVAEVGCPVCGVVLARVHQGPGGRLSVAYRAAGMNPERPVLNRRWSTWEVPNGSTWGGCESACQDVRCDGRFILDNHGFASSPSVPSMRGRFPDPLASRRRRHRALGPAASNLRRLPLAGRTAHRAGHPGTSDEDVAATSLTEANVRVIKRVRDRTVSA